MYGSRLAEIDLFRRQDLYNGLVEIEEESVLMELRCVGQEDGRVVYEGVIHNKFKDIILKVR